MGWRGALLVAVTVAACGFSESVRDEASAPPAHAEASQSLGTEIGEPTLEIVRMAEHVMAVELTFVAADEAQDPTSLRDPERVAGYPTRAALRELGVDAVRVIKTALTEWGNYDPDLLLRCKPDRLLGLRFIRRAARVDVALTDTCTRAIWSFERGGQPAHWGAVFSSEDGARIWALAAPRAGN